MASCSEIRFKQRAVIKFLVAENEPVTNIHRRLKNVYGDNAVDRSTVSRWAARFAGSDTGQAQLGDAPRSGRPTIAVNPSLLQRSD